MWSQSSDCDFYGVWLQIELSLSLDCMPAFPSLSLSLSLCLSLSLHVFMSIPRFYFCLSPDLPPQGLMNKTL